MSWSDLCKLHESCSTRFYAASELYLLSMARTPWKDSGVRRGPERQGPVRRLSHGSSSCIYLLGGTSMPLPASNGTTSSHPYQLSSGLCIWFLFLPEIIYSQRHDTVWLATTGGKNNRLSSPVIASSIPSSIPSLPASASTDKWVELSILERRV
jgi:hypothetical protein